jgi:hypothetical protein
MAKVIYTDEGPSVHWHNKEWAVVKTYGLLTGNMYQLYRRKSEREWARWPSDGINLYKTIKAAKEHALSITPQSNKGKE